MKITYRNIRNHQFITTFIVSILRNTTLCSLNWAKECESCIEHGLHLNDVNNHDGAVNDNESCEACLYHEQNLQLANLQLVILSRQQYRKDRDSPEEGMCYISSDMQKVIMIPRIPGCKTVIFQPRLTVYHQTFSPHGKANESLGIVWHSG